MATPNLEVEKYIQVKMTYDFHLQRLKIIALLIHQGLDEAFGKALSSKKQRNVPDEDFPDVFNSAYTTIILRLGDGVLRKVG